MDNNYLSFNQFLSELGLKASMNIIIHAGFKKLLDSFNGISPQNITESLIQLVTPNGSIIFPLSLIAIKNQQENTKYLTENSKRKGGIALRNIQIK